MTARAIKNKINDLQFWVNNNPKHPDYQQKYNLLLHFQFIHSQKTQLTA